MRTLINLARGLAMVALLVVVARADDGSKKSYDIPRGDAAAMLKQFSEVSGRETLFSAEVVRGVITNSVKGEFMPEQAIARLLEGTGLTAVADEKTGAFAVRRLDAGSQAGKSSQIVPVTVDTEKTAVLTKAVELTPYEVLGTRIRQTESEGPSPVSTYTAPQIQATGALTLSDFLSTIPQTYGGISVGRNSAPSDLNLTYGQRNEGSLPLTPFVGASPTATAPGQTGVSGVSLRSLGSGSTLILVDGRRIAQSPNGNRDSQSGQGFVDLDLIPLGLIDHIEIITDGASAIYGADAVAGVINIVLKKNWTGVDLTTDYKATTHGGGDERQGTLVVGFAGNEGHMHGTVALSYYERGTIMASQRSFSSQLNHTSIIKGYSATGAPVYGTDERIQFGYPATVQASGGAVSGNFDAIPGVRVVLTPTGYATPPPVSAFIPMTTVAVGQTGTTVNAQGQRPFNEAPYIELVPWSKRTGVNGTFNYTLENKIELYGGFGASDSRGVATTMLQYVSGITVPAAYNPFNQAVTIGMVLPGFGAIKQTTDNHDFNLTLGTRGKFMKTWQWDAGFRWDDQAAHQINRTFNSAAFTAAINNSDPTQRFNPFIDATAAGAPNQAAMMESFALYPTIDGVSGLRGLDFSADGDIIDIWGGPIKLAFGGSYERDSNTNTAVSYSAAVPTVGTATTYSTTMFTYAGYGELSVPIVGKPNALPGFKRLELQLAARAEDLVDSGRSTVPKYGFSWAPIQPLLLRASYSKGYRAPSPTENRVAASTITTSVNDPARGNVLTSITRINGPNPDLRPETSTTKFYGIVFEPKFIKGLTLQANYYSTIQKDAIQVDSTTTILNNEALFPGRVIRAPQTAADIAANQPGAIQTILIYPVNFGTVRNDSIDYMAEYNLPWENLGHWRVSLDASRTLKATRALTPGSPPINDVGDTYGGPRLKANGAIYWNNGPWTASLLVSYLSAFNSNLADVNGVAWNEATPAVEKFDVRAAYEFKNGIWRGYAKGFQVSVGVYNLLDKKPPFSDTIYSFDAALHSDYTFGRTIDISLKLPL